MSKKQSPPLENFEEHLNQLEQLVERLEHEALPLAEALKQFEQAMTLADQCQKALQVAEQQVEVWQQKLANNDEAH